jgi:hypothetical protein
MGASRSAATEDPSADFDGVRRIRSGVRIFGPTFPPTVFAGFGETVWGTLKRSESQPRSLMRGALFDAAERMAVARMISAFAPPTAAAESPPGWCNSRGSESAESDGRHEMAPLIDCLRTVEGDADAQRGIAEANATPEPSIAAIAGSGRGSLALSHCYDFQLRRPNWPVSRRVRSIRHGIRELLRIGAPPAAEEFSPCGLADVRVYVI